MSPTCRRAAALTSGHHPEPDPDPCSPGRPVTSASATAGLSAYVRMLFGPWPPGFKARVSVKQVRDAGDFGSAAQLPGAAWARQTGGSEAACRALGGEGR